MAASKPSIAFGLSLVILLVQVSFSSGIIFNSSSSAPLHGIELLSHLSFNAVASAAEAACDHHLSASASAAVAQPPSALKLHLKRRAAHDTTPAKRSRKETVKDSTGRDVLRIQALFNRITEKNNKKRRSDLMGEKKGSAAAATTPELAGQLMATLESGVALGSGEYFMDVFVGTPPRHFSLIVDTGSDLNWIQCLPCHDCFEQSGPFYDPAASSSYRNLSCADPRCALVSPPEPASTAACRRGAADDSCPYFYWYGDHSNTTGDLALETFTMNLTASSGGATGSRRVNGVVFGCGHWNRGLFHGAAGLLGLGRGPLSFASQIRSLYGHTFSYCFVDRNSDLSVSSKLIFGEDPSLLAHPNLNFTTFAAGADNSADTFYYVQIKDILVGGVKLNIPTETWKLSEGAGGTIVDSGTTLSYFADPAYRAIKDAFLGQIKDYPRAEDFLVLSPCYNVSSAEKVELPEFTIVFADGAVWDFPAENYFIRLDPEEIVCLAILGTPRSSLSIIGNYQQQNFHITYDMKNSRLGFAPAKCAEV